MSFLDELLAKKKCLKSTITKITYADGTQEQIPILNKNNANTNSKVKTVKLKSKAYGFVVDTKPDLIPSCILDNFLYLGSQDAVNLENVQQFKITDVLSIGIQTPDTNINFGDGSNSTIRKHYVDCLDLPETSLKPMIKRAFEIMNDVFVENGTILIHCNAGVSRSASICIAYLILEKNMSFDAAFALVKSKRECIQPNPGFLQQLKKLNQSEIKKNKTIVIT